MGQFSITGGTLLKSGRLRVRIGDTIQFTWWTTHTRGGLVTHTMPITMTPAVLRKIRRVRR